MTGMDKSQRMAATVQRALEYLMALNLLAIFALIARMAFVATLGSV